MSIKLLATDLDGTLLDDDYLYEQAAEALDSLASTYPDAQTALVSSKTPAEMIELAQELYEASAKRVSTGELNRVLKRALEARSPSSKGS